MHDGKYWRKREKQIMRDLGLHPTPGSGAGELWKEDGSNETYIAQLKSTAGKGVTVSREALKALLTHAIMSHKIPLFVLDIVDYEPMVSMPLSHFTQLVGGTSDEDTTDESQTSSPRTPRV